MWLIVNYDNSWLCVAMLCVAMLCVARLCVVMLGVVKLCVVMLGVRVCIDKVVGRFA